MSISAHIRHDHVGFAREPDIDLERVVIDPEYRRRVILFLNAQARRSERSRPCLAHAGSDAFNGSGPRS